MSDSDAIIDSREELHVLISEEQIRTRIAELGREIRARYDGEPIHVVAVLKGSFVFLADLVRAIETDNLTVDFLGLSSYGDSMRSSGEVRVTQDLSAPIEGKNVLVIEDIIDTGLTIKYLMENLRTRRPKSLEICTLLHKPDNTNGEFDIAWVGFTIPNEFVIGYGLDYAERFRNVPFIGVVRT
jgi:hypoxanthine phosphoribosyltransferase